MKHYAASLCGRCPVYKVCTTSFPVTSCNMMKLARRIYDSGDDVHESESLRVYYAQGGQ